MRGYFFFGNKKCRIYAACGVLQTPNCVEHERKQYEIEIVRTERKNKCSIVTNFIRGRRKKAMRESLQRELKKTVKSFEDVFAENISYLIQSREGLYIVYLDIEDDLDWSITDEGEKILNKEKFWTLMSIVNSLQNKPCVIQLGKKKKRQYNCLLGTALILAIEGREEEFKKCIKEAEKYIEEREYEITRKWNAEICFVTFIAISVLYSLGRRILNNDSQINYLNFLWYGAVGVLFSVLQHNAYINASCTAGKTLLTCEVISKYIVGMISSFIVVYAFKAGIFMTGFVAEKHEKEFMLLLGIIAGFSERLAPSLIGKIEGKEGTTDEKENTDNF